MKAGLGLGEMARELTKKEKDWIKQFKQCLKRMPKTMNLYISNEETTFQIYDPDTKEILDESIKHRFEQGDPMDKVFDMDRA